MHDRRGEEPEEKPDAERPADSGYTEDEEAEVRKRLEDLGYVE
jgi:hypothetical protein